MMKKTVVSLVSVACAAGFSLLPILGLAQDPAKQEPAKKTDINFEKEIFPIIKANCIGCHNKDNAKHNVSFPDKMTLEDAKKNPRLWRRSAREVKGGHMPPRGNGTMGDKDKKKLLDWVSATFPMPTNPPSGGGTTSGGK